MRLLRFLTGGSTHAVRPHTKLKMAELSPDKAKSPGRRPRLFCIHFRLSPIGVSIPTEHFSKEWDDAPMPHSVFFTKQGHAIHGSFDTKRLGSPASHGCVRLAPANAAKLFSLVQQEGLPNTQVVLTGSEHVALDRAKLRRLANGERRPADRQTDSDFPTGSGRNFPPPMPADQNSEAEYMQPRYGYRYVSPSRDRTSTPVHGEPRSFDSAEESYRRPYAVSRGLFN
jgi:hypothetical protein